MESYEHTIKQFTVMLGLTRHNTLRYFLIHKNVQQYLTIVSQFFVES